MKWKFILAYSVLDLVAAGVISQFFEGDERKGAFFAILIVLWLIQIPVGLWALARFWIVFGLYSKEKTLRLIISEMTKFDFPDGKEFFSAEDYLSHVINSEETSIDTKLKAASIAGELSAYSSAAAFTTAAAYRICFEKAIFIYSPRGPSKRPDADLMTFR